MWIGWTLGLASKYKDASRLMKSNSIIHHTSPEYKDGNFKFEKSKLNRRPFSFLKKRKK